MNDQDFQEYLDRIVTITNLAQEKIRQLPISIPGPIRDQILFSVIRDQVEDEREGIEDKDHQARHCPSCINAALSLSLNALGWEDRAAPRQGGAEERMRILLEQFRIALDFFDGLKMHERRAKPPKLVS